MASTLSNINQALVDDRVIPALRYVLPLLRAFSLRIETQGKIKTDSIYVPIATDPSGAAKTAGTLATGSGTLAGSQVTLDTLWGAGWDATETSISARLFEAYWADKAAGGVYVLAKKVIDSALALITAANYGDDDEDKLVVAPADFGQNDLAELWKKAQEKILQREQTLMLNSAYAAALMGNSNLALVFATQGQGFVSNGMLPSPLLGMPGHHYGAFPTNSQSLGGAVLGRAAILVATAPIDSLMAAGDGNIVERRDITEPESGLTVTLTTKADAGGTVSGEVAVLFGVLKGQDACVRLKSAV